MNLNHRITTALVGIFLARPGPEEPGGREGELREHREDALRGGGKDETWKRHEGGISPTGTPGSQRQHLDRREPCQRASGADVP
mgnify:CR=1 FL=1